MSHPRSQSLLLTIDVGNTATNFAVYEIRSRRRSPQPRAEWTLATKVLANKSVKKNSIFIKKTAWLSHHSLDGVIISSVVPMVNPNLKRVIQSLWGVRPIFVNGRIETKVRVLYHRPQEVGADRIVNARAVREFTSRPCIVVDFGTATTFDCINRKGEFLGGVIAPGPQISAEALYNKTAQLPLVTLDKPTRILGRTTLACIQAGLYYGYRGLVKEIVFQLKRALGSDTVVFSTGGQAHWILKGLDIIDRDIRQLTLMGLYHMWHDLNKSTSGGRHD